MNKKVDFVDEVCNLEYSFAVAKGLDEKMMVKHCNLKFSSGGVLGMLSAVEAMPFLSKEWRSKVQTKLARTK